MAIQIEQVKLSKNPVQTGESLIISVTIVHHGYLSKSTHRQLSDYTHGELKERGMTDQGGVA